MIKDWIISVLIILIAAYVLPGVTTSVIAAIIFSIILAGLNLFIKPLLTLITLPINILTFGLFSLIINGLIIFLASGIVPGFSVASFWWAVLFSVVVSLISAVFVAYSENN